MKKSIMLMLAALLTFSVNAKTLRVNNNTGSGAPYTSIDDALTDAEDGDVIILEKSTKSYGTFAVKKTITIQGEGYFLDINEVSEEGLSSTTVGPVTLRAPEIKLIGLNITGNLYLSDAASSSVITRCCITDMYHTSDYAVSTLVGNCIIHQNFITGSISFSSVSSPTYMQITNNIFTRNGQCISGVKNSVITRNTFVSENSPIAYVENCTLENNINGFGSESSNNYTSNVNNIQFTTEDLTNDLTMQEAELALNVDAGAFSGDDPYVLSGVSTGVRIIDLSVPTSVEQGQDLQVTVKIGSSR